MQTRARMRCGVAFAVCFVAAMGCASFEEPDKSPVGKESSNGLVLTDAALRRLSPAPLSALAPVLDTDYAGQQMLDYAVRCALSQDETLVVGGRDIPGLLGLAPAWRDQPCNGECQGWVSACLLAHGNVPGLSVPIWLRGNHPALGSAPADVPFSYQEAAFYGDLFVAADESRQMFACLGRDVFGPLNRGEDEVQIIEETLEEWLHHRMCKLTDECGISMVGLCQSDGIAELATCDRDAGTAGAYSACHSWPAGARAETSDDAVFDQVITVYLED